MTRSSSQNPTIEFEAADLSRSSNGFNRMPYVIALMAALGIVLALRTGNWSYVAGGVAAAVLLSRRLGASRTQSPEQPSRRVLRSRGSAGRANRQRLTLNDQELSEECGGGSQAARYSRITGIEETSDSVTILVGEDEAFVIPRQRVTAGDLGRFVTVLRDQMKVHVLQDAKRELAAGSWSVLMFPEFRVMHHTDGWQAHHGDRIAFVSSLAVVQSDGNTSTAGALWATVARTLSVPSDERLNHTADGLRGVAEVRRCAEGWQLKGFMCADGTVATCVIDYRAAEHEPWAVATWRSLQHPNAGSLAG